MAQINEDTVAMNTARQSAVSMKLRPRGTLTFTVIVLPVSAAGMSAAAAMKDADIAASASAFLSLVDIYPANGAITAPISGMKTQAISIVSFVMFLS